MVESAIGYLNRSWWRSAPVSTPAQAQADLDRFCATVADERRRKDGAVGSLADAEPLLALPASPFPAELEAERTVTPRRWSGRCSQERHDERQGRRFLSARPRPPRRTLEGKPARRSLRSWLLASTGDPIRTTLERSCILPTPGWPIDAGHRVYYTTAAELVARTSKAAAEGRWAATMRFWAGPAVLVIDDLGYLPMPGEAASHLFQVISRRYEKGATILTTNRGIASWGEIFEDTTVAAAVLDRLLHRATVGHIDGGSYRMRSHRDALKTARAALSGG